MRPWSVVIASTLLFGCVRNPNSVTAGDAQQLIKTVLANDLSYAKAGKRKICVQRELEPPLHDTRENWKTAGQPPANEHLRWVVGFNPVNVELAKSLDQAFRDAVLGRGTDASVDVISSTEPPLILFPRGHEPKECDVSTFAPNGPFVKYVARPVIAGGYAFIEKNGVCGTLCGSGFVRVFQKRNGQWEQVATLPTWIA